MYAIYLNHQHGEAVLLTDGAFTSEANCFMREYGVVWHKPRLFATKGGAKVYAWKTGREGKRFRIKKYTGPKEPWDRAA